MRGKRARELRELARIAGMTQAQYRRLKRNYRAVMAWSVKDRREAAAAAVKQLESLRNGGSA